MCQQRRTDPFCDLGDVDHVVSVIVRAQDVRDGDPVAYRALLECRGEPVAVDQHTVPARLVGDQIRV